MFMKAEILPTVDGRSLSEIKLGKNTGECSKIIFDDHSSGKEVFIVDSDGVYLVHLYIDKLNRVESLPNIYRIHTLSTAYHVINEIVPDLEGQIYNFEFDIN